MSQTRFSGPILSGSTTNAGAAVLTQTGVLTQTAAGTTDLTFELPANAQIIDIIVDVITPWNSATSAVITVGTVSAGTQYVTSINAKTAVRTVNFAATAAQLAAMQDITTNTSVVATVVSVGVTTAGTARVTVLYRQN